MARFPTIDVSQASYLQVKHRISEAQFGNGFRQRLGQAGASRRTWHVKFLDKPAADIARVDAFLNSLSGSTPFFWHPPTGTVMQFVCAEWKITPVNNALASLEALFIEA